MSEQSSEMPDEREKTRSKKKKVKKKWIVEWKAKKGMATLFFAEWSKYNAYEKESVAQEVIDKKNYTDKYFQYRMKDK